MYYVYGVYLVCELDLILLDSIRTAKKSITEGGLVLMIRLAGL
jgi:hypothetical protein